MSLRSKACTPCTKDTPTLPTSKIQELSPQINAEWNIVESKKIVRIFKFKTFKESIEFVNNVADIAETEKHHPDIIIRYNKVTLELSTHVIRGLSENDFIIASKIDALYGWKKELEKVVAAKAAKFLTIRVLVVLILITLIMLILRIRGFI